MAFRLGNFSIDEILEAVAENFEGEVLYSLDQLQSASIEITSEKTDITDKKGNIVRSIYKSKQGNFSATNAFLHPQIMNAASGSTIQKAGSGTGEAIVAPKILLLPAGTSAYELTGISADVIPEVIGVFGAGANSERLTRSTASPAEATFDGDTGTFVFDTTTKKITVPAAGDNAPLNYLVKFDRDMTSGWKLSNTVDSFPPTVCLTLYCSYVDPCDDDLKPLYVVLPSFQASPETTISLSSDEQNMDFNGSIQVDYCATSPALYYIYIPDEDIVVVGE